MPARAAAVFGAVLFFLAALKPAFPQTLSSAADRAALLRLRADLGLRARDWPRRSDPCSSWTGVSCRSGRVFSLNLSGLRRTRLARLNPRFAVGALENLTALSSFNSTGFALPGPFPDRFAFLLPDSLSFLDLTGSLVTGPIPYSLSAAGSLAVLSLSENSITGNIPPTLGQLGNLTALDLSRNSISGSIPPSLSSLGNLTALDLSSNFLSGELPASLGGLPSLKTLNLSSNSVSGSVPTEFGNLTALTSLDLSLNSLFGGLPTEFRNLGNLQDLNLEGNSLTGALPGGLFLSSSQLRSVKLGNNNFSGSLPDPLWSLPNLQVLDFSDNNLTGQLPDAVPANAGANGSVFNLSNNLFYGSIPSSFKRSVLARFSSVDLSGNYFQGEIPVGNGSRIESFRSNCFRNAKDQRSSADCEQFYSARGIPYDGNVSPVMPPFSPPSHKKSKLKYILIGGIGGIVLLVIVVIVLVLCVRRCGARRTDQRESSMNTTINTASPGVAPPPSNVPSSGGLSVNLLVVGEKFTYEQLVKATAEFSDMNLIKHGHSGDLYHGILEGGNPVVVKRINVGGVRKTGYVVELEFFGKASHVRLVPFLGHCLENENEKFLVYQYMPHGDLSNALYIKPRQEEEGLQSLDWITRLKIATGVAEALCYLHQECTPPLVHRDVQASSILLDDKFEVRLGSLSEVCAQEGDSHQNVITRFLRLSSQTSEQNVPGSPSATCAYDVYCLGKVLLELVTGKLGISGSNDAPTAEWLERTLPYINIYEKELVTKIVDPSLIVDEDLLEEVWAMAIVAKSCLNPKPSKRPLVRFILKALENPLKVVREENNSGSARLRAGSSRGSWNAAFFGSWRHSSSDIASVSGPPIREERSLKRSGTTRSQGSGGEHSFNHRRPSKEIFPEPSAARDIED